MFMEPLVTAGQMRECDRIAIQTLGVPGSVLMENAGRAVAMAVERRMESLHGRTIFVVCGKGNNGGDGYVAARHLVYARAKVVLLLLGKPTQAKSDAATHLKIIQKVLKKNKKIEIQLINSPSMKLLHQLGKPDIIVDALFGTGFSSMVRKPYVEIMKWMNDRNVPIVSVDIPSGLNSDNGKVENIAVKAAETVTMGLKKIGLIVGKGPEYAGTITLERIGVPEQVYPLDTIKTHLVESEDVRNRLPKRPFNAHKHSVGKVFVIAGSPGLTGAAAMASHASMVTGAGAVVLGTPRSVYPILAKKLTEVMTEPLTDTEDGVISMKAYSIIKKYVEWADAVIIGPGLGKHAETQSLLFRLIGEVDKPLLIDADGINMLAGHTSQLKKNRNQKIVLTPHTGELSRLTGIASGEIENNRVEIARSTARKLALTLVLKGAPTVTASDGDVFVNSSGNPGMATAGSGDVLAGIIGTLLSQNMKRSEAAYCGVYIHGLAGDCARKVLGERSLMAMDILQNIPSALRTIESAVGL
jgi:hydroxyethylthiazole kinase-like uncharacterized protein yjeF